MNNVGTRIDNDFAAQWLAYTLPYRRFADVLADACARIGGDVEIATPSPQWTFTTYSLPVSRRTHSRCGLHTRAVTKTVTVIRRLQTLRHLHACSGRFRLERSPGGACTRWKRAALSRRTWKTDLRHHRFRFTGATPSGYDY